MSFLEGLRFKKDYGKSQQGKVVVQTSGTGKGQTDGQRASMHEEQHQPVRTSINDRSGK